MLNPIGNFYTVNKLVDHLSHIFKVLQCAEEKEENEQSRQ